MPDEYKSMFQKAKNWCEDDSLYFYGGDDLIAVVALHYKVEKELQVKKKVEMNLLTKQLFREAFIHCIVFAAKNHSS